MGRKVALGALALLVILAAGGALLVRSWLDPEHVRRTLERQASLAVGQPVAIGAAELSVWPRAGVTLRDVTIGAPAALTLTRTSLSTSMRALFDRRIEDAELLVEDSAVDLPLLLATLDRLAASGAPDGPAARSDQATDGSAGRGLTLVNVRTISLRDVRVQAGARSAVLALQSAIDGDRLRVDAASVVSDVTALEATGAIESLADRRAALTVTAETLDLDGLLVFAQEFARQALPANGTASGGGPTTPPEAGPMDITLQVKATRGRAGGVAFERLDATARITPGQVALSPVSMGIFGGRVQGNVRAELAQTDPALHVEGTLQGVDMARVTEFTGQPGAVTGTLGGTVRMAGSGADAATALARARGSGEVTIANGTVKGLQLVRPIVLAFGKPDAAQPVAGGERFDRLDASFTLAGGIVTLTSVSFQSRDVELDGTGRLNLRDGTVDLAANTRLSRDLTAQAGRDLVRYTADDGRVTVPTTVTGTIESPQVGVNLGGLARRAVENEVRRQTDELKQKGESAIRGLLRRKKR